MASFHYRRNLMSHWPHSNVVWYWLNILSVCLPVSAKVAPKWHRDFSVIFSEFLRYLATKTSTISKRYKLLSCVKKKTIYQTNLSHKILQHVLLCWVFISQFIESPNSIYVYRSQCSLKWPLQIPLREAIHHHIWIPFS